MSEFTGCKEDALFIDNKSKAVVHECGFIDNNIAISTVEGDKSFVTETEFKNNKVNVKMLNY